MMQYNKNNGIEFREIVLNHVKRILELSSHELKNNTQVVNHGNYSQTTIQEDTRYSYIQAIENLAYVLMPYFDSKIKDVYKTCIKKITSFDYEILNELKKEYEKVCEDAGEKNIGKSFVMEIKIRSAKKLFYELNLLLKRKAYLKKEIYGDEGFIEEDGKDEEDKKDEEKEKDEEDKNEEDKK